MYAGVLQIALCIAVRQMVTQIFSLFVSSSSEALENRIKKNSYYF